MQDNNIDDEIHAILSDDPEQSTEYHVMLSKPSSKTYPYEFGFYMLADNVAEARETAEKLYPPPYRIVGIQPIRLGI